MSNLAKLSKQAVQHEHDRQFEKALTVYARLFEEAAGADEEVDVAMYNRAGDAAMRVGDGARAVQYYERAVDGYAAGGLLNNAIAVCNKLLRHAPDHAATHYTLAVLHAKQGFRGDAKHHFVEYAERMHRAGKKDEALRALTEFAALCPPGDDARTFLAQHMSRGNRSSEVASHLQSMLDGRVESPAAPAPAAAAASAAAPADLVFLDVNGDAYAALPPSAVDVEPPVVAPIVAIDAAIELEVEPLVELDGAGAFASAADGIVELELEPLDATDLGVEAIAAPASQPIAAPRWSSALPGELPPLSVGGWLGSASVVVEADAVAQASALDDVLGATEAFVDAAQELTFVSDGIVDLHVEPATDLPLLDDELDAPLAAHESTPSLAFLDDAHVDVDDETDAMPAMPTGDALPLDAPAPSPRSEEFLDLGAWLRDDEPAPSTRLLTDESTPTGDETADFERLLGIFRAGLARNLDAGDFDSHYDLGVAFREMGLIDEAIAEFQKAAQAPGGALRAREALGQCFLDRGSPELAASTLERAIAEGTGGESRDESRLLGVVYLLGDAHARLGRGAAARACFERVVATDIEFRDAATRLMHLSASSP